METGIKIYCVLLVISWIVSMAAGIILIFKEIKIQSGPAGQTTNMLVVVTQEQIDEVLNECVESETTGVSKFPGMTYEQGLQAMAKWLTENGATHPLAE